jgi:aminopeptidase N
VHETAHEWFGNSITANDVADNWIHEGFASYAEVLFTECEFGKEAGNDYCGGVRKNIDNDITVIGKYGVKTEGSGDMYNKGSNVIHMIRQLVDDDEKFRMILRDLSKTFYHKIITTKEFENYLTLNTGIDLKPLFDQYLRTTKIPRLEYRLIQKKLAFRYINCNEGFNMPVKINADKEIWIKPTTQWQTMNLEKAVKTISLDRNVYVELVK